MSSTVTRPAEARMTWTGALSLVRDNPLIPLIVLLLVLVGILEYLRPGIVNDRWIANTVKFAIPLAILGAILQPQPEYHYHQCW